MGDQELGIYLSHRLEFPVTADITSYAELRNILHGKVLFIFLLLVD